MASTIFSRKLDFAYLVFFIIHVPVMLCVDLTPLYPTSVKPKFMTALRNWYIVTYSDQFFISPPRWFEVYTILEAAMHLPISLWAIGALLRDDPRVPLVLLIFAAETVITTLTCVADYTSWESVSWEVKQGLHGLYLPYLCLGLLMMIDNGRRINNKLIAASLQPSTKKKI